jgi:hypothetical protein
MDEDNFDEKWKELRLCVINNDWDGLMRYGYNMYMEDEGLWTTELNSIKMMAFDVRLKIDALNNVIYYFETIGDYQKASKISEVKQIIKDSFRNMVKLLKINKSQVN